jgi:hypothetical protein
VSDCEFCLRCVPTERHHVARGKDRAVCDKHPELILNLCRACHTTIEDQHDQRAIGLALLVRAGRGSVFAICELFYGVTQRRMPDVPIVQMWVRRLSPAPARSASR